MERFLIETTYDFHDRDFNGDFYKMQLIDERMEAIMEGDYYHDKIEEKIEGFFKCLDYLQIEYEKEEINLNAEEDEY